MPSRRALAVGLAVVLSMLSGCDSVKVAPKIIEADGNTFLACSGLVRTSRASGMFSDTTVLKVSFTDSGRRSHTIWGISTLTISDPQKEDIAPFPAVLPDTSLSVDMEGKPYVNGKVYTWPDGTKAQLNGGRWQPVVVGTACQ